MVNNKRKESTMTQNSEKNLPAATIRDRSLKAVIWGNPAGEHDSIRYSVELSAGYKTAEGEWKDTKSFNESELLRVARLAQLAFDKIGELRQNDLATTSQ